MQPTPLPMKTILVGGGRHAAVIVEAMQAMGCFDIAGFLDPDPSLEDLLGLKRLGGDDDLPRLRGEGVAAAVIAIGSNKLRLRIGKAAEAAGFILPAVIHPSASISPTARVEAGAVVMARALIGTEARVGRLAIVNSGAVVDHDADLGEASHVAPGCALAGSITVGQCALVGVGSAVRPGIRIGDHAVIGAGSAVVKDVPPSATVGGAPARSLV